MLHEDDVTLDSGEHTFIDVDIARHKSGNNWFRLLTDDTDEEFTFDLDAPPLISPPILSIDPYFEATIAGVREIDGAFLDVLVSNRGGNGSHTVDIEIDGVEVYREVHTISSGGYEFIEIDISDTSVGEHEVTLYTPDIGNRTETIERTKQILYSPPTFGGAEHIDATVTRTVERSTGMECEVLVSNVAGSTVYTTVALEDENGSVYDEAEVRVTSGGYAFTTLVVPSQSAGTYSVVLRTDHETETFEVAFTDAPLRDPIAPDYDPYFDATIVDVVAQRTHTELHVLCTNSGGESDQTDVWVEDDRGTELDATTTRLLEAGEFQMLTLDITDITGNATISVFTIDTTETVDIILGDPTLIERQVTGAITVPEDEGTGLRDGEADWASAGHIAGLAARANASDYVEHGLDITYETDDTLTISGGLAFVHVNENISVQDANGNYTRTWRSGITIATEMPITQNVGLYEGVTNYVYLALDMRENNGASYFVAEDSEELPEGPHLLLGVVDADAGTVTQTNRAPDLVAESITAGEAHIDSLEFDDIVADTIEANELELDSLILDMLDARRVDAERFDGTNATLATAEIDDITAQAISGAVAEFAEATIEALIADSAEITELVADRIEATEELQLPVRTEGYSDIGHGRLYTRE